LQIGPKIKTTTGQATETR